MSDHIATNSSFDATELQPFVSECPYCLKICDRQPGWLGLRCINCNEIQGDECSYEHRVRHYRTILNLTKSQIGLIIGKSKHTIHSYEWRKCPIHYFEFMKKKVKEKNE